LNDKIALKRLEWQLENIAGQLHSNCYPCIKGAESFRTFCFQNVVIFKLFGIDNWMCIKVRKG